MISPKKWEKKGKKINSIGIDLLTKEILIKLKFALSLSINSKSQTQHLPKWMCFAPLKNKQGPASFAHKWDLGEEVPFELNLLGFQHKSLKNK